MFGSEARYRAEKARLTYEFMDYSLHLYKEVRQHLRETLQECAAAGRASVSASVDEDTIARNLGLSSAVVPSRRYPRGSKRV